MNNNTVDRIELNFADSVYKNYPTLIFHIEKDELFLFNSLCLIFKDKEF